MTAEIFDIVVDSEKDDLYFVYFLHNTVGDILYIGKTTRLRARLMQHFVSELVKVEPWRASVDRENIATIQCPNACDMELYETYFINKYKPLYNKDKIFNCAPSFDLPYVKPLTYRFKLKMIKGGGNFKDHCVMYRNYPEQRESIDKKYPLIKEAYEVLGADKIRALGCDSSRIKRELENLDNSEVIISEIKKTFSGGFYLAKDVKIIIQDIYDNLGIVKTAKAKDIESVFNVQLKSKRIKDKVVNGYFIKEDALEDS